MIQSTDLSIGYIGLVGCKPERKFRVSKAIPRILVSVSNLKRVLSAIPKKIKDISLETTWDGQGLIINNTITVVCGMSVDDFPIFPKLPFGKQYNGIIDYAQLTCFNSFSAKKDDGRIYKTHLYFDADKDNVVATDGNRLHIVKFNSDKMLNESFMLHYDAVELLTCTQLRNKIGAVSFSKRDVFIQTGNGYITIMKPEENNFPDYKDIISVFDRENPKAVISATDKQFFIDEIVEAKTITSEHYRAVTFNLNGRVVLSSMNPDIGEFKKDITDNLSYISFKNTDIEMSFNPEYLISACKDLPDNELYMMSFLDENHPAIIESETGYFKAVVMPMNSN